MSYLGGPTPTALRCVPQDAEAFREEVRQSVGGRRALKAKRTGQGTQTDWRENPCRRVRPLRAAHPIISRPCRPGVNIQEWRRHARRAPLRIVRLTLTGRTWFVLRDVVRGVFGSDGISRDTPPAWRLKRFAPLGSPAVSWRGSHLLHISGTTMKRALFSTTVAWGLLALALCLAPRQAAVAQEISIYQYRHVPAEHVAEFVERETKYWSQIAQKAIDDGKMQLWALLEKVGGYDLPNSSNYLFINSFRDVDAAGDVWDVSAVFPDVPMEEMDTSGLSTVTSVFFVRPETWVQADHAVPSEDFRYVTMVYHNASDAGQLIALENEHWTPFIKAAMDNKQISQVAWGNATILSPSGEDIKANTISYDVYPSLKEALDPTWDENLTVPEGLTQIQDLELNRRGTAIYRFVHMISAPSGQ